MEKLPRGGMTAEDPKRELVVVREIDGLEKEVV
jgi:hypothetical protein